jgi:hypothetical protein
LVEKIIRSQEKIEADNNKNSQKNIESNNSSKSVTKEEMENYFAALEPVLKKTFNAMIKLINCHPEDKGFFKEIIETEFRTWEMMLQDLISGKSSTISESTNSHPPRFKDEAVLNAMYARIQARPYTPGPNGCGAGSGFGSVRFIPQYSGFVYPYGAISEIFKNGKNYLEDPNLCRCTKGGSRPHFHCPGRIRFGKNKGRLCEHPIRVGFGIKRCSKCGEGKKC